MTKTLEVRLQNARSALGRVDAALVRHSAKLPADVEGQFKTIAAFALQVEHWTQLLAARHTARALLSDLELQADPNDDVPYGSASAKFQTVRLLGVQAYLAAQWALADRLVGMAGHVLCIRSSLQDPKNAPQLISHFIGGRGPEGKTAAIVFYSLRMSFGWPVAISYALRNHFLHDGGAGDFFVGPNAASAFKVSSAGWARIEERVREYNVNAAHTRSPNTFAPSAGDDLRKILDTCAAEIDEALGVLVGSACQMAIAHVGFMLGED